MFYWSWARGPVLIHFLLNCLHQVRKVSASPFVYLCVTSGFEFASYFLEWISEIFRQDGIIFPHLIGYTVFYLQLFVGGCMSYLNYLCLFAHSGVQHILYGVFVLLRSMSNISWRQRRIDKRLIMSHNRFFLCSRGVISCKYST